MPKWLGLASVVGQYTFLFCETALAEAEHRPSICPGRHFAMDTIFLWAASVLATFNVAQPRDEAGNRVPLELQLRFELVA